jgi:hypothetical protein
MGKQGRGKGGEGAIQWRQSTGARCCIKNRIAGGGGANTSFERMNGGPACTEGGKLLQDGP